MKIIVIGSKDHGSKNDPAVLAESVRVDAVQSTVVYWEDIIFHVKTDDVTLTYQGEDIFAEPVDLIIATGWYKTGYRDVAYALALVAGAKNVPLWNSEIANQRSSTKLSCMVQLALEGVSVPETIFSLTDSSYIADRPLPFIAKASAASRGQSNYLIETEDDRRMMVDRKQTDFLVQPFMPNDHDLRVICFDGKPQLVLKRARAEDSESHLNNTSQGGSAEWLDLSQVSAELLTISEKICTIMSREMAGIDFIPDASSPYQYSCLEVNAIPQLTSGVDVEIKMAALKNSINRLKERT